MSGQILAETPFQIVPPGPWPGWLLKLLLGAGALLAGALARAVIRKWWTPQDERTRRVLDQPPGDIQVESHTSPVEVNVEPKLDDTRTFTVRLEPHHDPGTQTLQEATP
jgi:hypothetical protein